MSLIYSFVARGPDTVLAEYTTYTGNFTTVAIQCLQKTPQKNSKFTYQCDGHTFNYLVDNGYTFLVVADEAAGRQLPYACLQKIKTEFNDTWAEKSRDALAHSLDKKFGPRLKFIMDDCTNNSAELSKVSKVQTQVDEVKNIMMDNIEKVLDRGEKIELLVDKTDNLRFQADNFHRTGRQLRRKMWWQNMKMKLVLAGIGGIVILVIFLVACYGGGRKCTG